MSLPTFFLPSNKPILEATVIVEGEEFHHLRVRRVRKGERVRLIDGRGTEFLGLVECLERHQAKIRILDSCAGSNESPLDTTLAVALVREDRLAYALEKATELGASRIIVFGSARARRYDYESRLSRWQKIVSEATKQCQRSCVPTVTTVDSLESLPPLTPCTLGLALHVAAKITGPNVATPWIRHRPTRVTVAVGPEGGFSEKEVSFLEAMGFLAVNLGPRILRTETAVVAALSLVQFLWGDLCPSELERDG